MSHRPQRSTHAHRTRRSALAHHTWRSALAHYVLRSTLLVTHAMANRVLLPVVAMSLPDGVIIGLGRLLLSVVDEGTPVMVDVDVGILVAHAAAPTYFGMLGVCELT